MAQQQAPTFSHLCSESENLDMSPLYGIRGEYVEHAKNMTNHKMWDGE